MFILNATTTGTSGTEELKRQPLTQKQVFHSLKRTVSLPSRMTDTQHSLSTIDDFNDDSDIASIVYGPDGAWTVKKGDVLEFNSTSHFTSTLSAWAFIKFNGTSYC